MFYFILKILDYTSSYYDNTTIVSTYTGSTRVFRVDFRNKKDRKDICLPVSA